MTSLEVQHEDEKKKEEAPDAKENQEMTVPLLAQWRLTTSTNSGPPL